MKQFLSPSHLGQQAQATDILGLGPGGKNFLGDKSLVREL